MSSAKTIVLYVFQYGFQRSPPQRTIETGGLITWQHWISQDEPRPNQFHATETLLQNEPLFQSVSRRWLLAMMKSDFLMRKTPCFQLVSFVSIRFPKPASPKHNWNVWKIAIGYQSISFLCVSIGFPKPTSPNHYWNVWKVDVGCQLINFMCFTRVSGARVPPDHCFYKQLFLVVLISFSETCVS